MNAKELGKLKTDAKKAFKAWDKLRNEREAEMKAAISKAYKGLYPVLAKL
jgi:hypothetical protein